VAACIGSAAAAVANGALEDAASTAVIPNAVSPIARVSARPRLMPRPRRVPSVVIIPFPPSPCLVEV
jgi:hypothetical protein